MNTDLAGLVEGWTREAEGLQKQVVAVIASGHREVVGQLVDRLVPDDFCDDVFRRQFCELRDRMVAERSVDTDWPDLLFELPLPANIQSLARRLVTVSAAIKFADSIGRTLDGMRADLDGFWALAETHSDIVSRAVRCRALLETEPVVWGAAQDRLLQEVMRVEADFKEGERQSLAETGEGVTGIVELDRTIGRPLPGRLYVLAAAPNEGKSAAIAMLARRAAVSGKRCGVICLRDTAETMGRRVAISDLVFENPLLKQLSSKQKIRDFFVGIMEMEGYFPAISSLPAPSIVQVCEFARELAMVKRIEYLLIDDAAGPHLSDKNGPAEIFPRIRQLAVELGIPVFVAAGIPPQDGSGSDSPPWLGDFLAADWVGKLCRVSTPDGDPIHQIDVIRNAVGLKARVALYYHKDLQQFFSLHGICP